MAKLWMMSVPLVLDRQKGEDLRAGPLGLSTPPNPGLSPSFGLESSVSCPSPHPKPEPGFQQEQAPEAFCTFGVCLASSVGTRPVPDKELLDTPVHGQVGWGAPSLCWERQLGFKFNPSSHSSKET